MFTEDDEKDLRRLIQKRQRARETTARQAMLRWSASELGQAARKRYLESGGREKQAESRALGTEAYARKNKLRQDSIKAAEKRRRHWTAAEEAELLKLHAEGVPAPEIAKILSRSIEGIEKKRAKLKREAI